jgi:hypothetical protein
MSSGWMKDCIFSNAVIAIIAVAAVGAQLQTKNIGRLSSFMNTPELEHLLIEKD